MLVCMRIQYASRRAPFGACVDGRMDGCGLASTWAALSRTCCSMMSAPSEPIRPKRPRRPQDQSIGVAAGVKTDLRESRNLAVAKFRSILHGTTVATNAVLEGKGARVGLLVTEGFEYTLHLAKAWTPGAAVRLDRHGQARSARLACRHARHSGAHECARRGRPPARRRESDGVDRRSLLVRHRGAHHFADARLRQSANTSDGLRDIVAERYPDIPVSLSSEILPEFREYDRAITTVMNDYVRPIMKRYLSRIEDRLKDEDVKARLHIVRSDGGLMSADGCFGAPGAHGSFGTGRRRHLDRDDRAPNRLQEAACFRYGRHFDRRSVILDGEPTISRSTEVGYFPAKVPTLDVRSVGAGGGSIAEVSELTKSLRVGPRSAGAKPGPVAYGLGGVEPTVSDANVVLGYLPPVLLGGDMALDVAARQGRDCQGRAGDRLVGRGGGQGHHRHRQRSHARRAARHHGAARPRSARFRHRRLWRRGTLACQRAGRTAGLLSGAGARRARVCLSALGFLEAEFKNEFVQTFIRSTVGLDPREVWSRFATLGEKAKAWLDEQEVAQGDRSVGYSFDLRYEQQGFEVTIDVPAELVAESGADRRNPRPVPRHP